jgi:hypothetical protein
VDDRGKSIQTTTAPPESEPVDQPAQVGPWQCAAHPSVETYLRCGRCERPICPKCMIQTPVGSRCRDCARMRKPPTYNPTILDYLRGAAGALAVAFGGGFLISLLFGGRPMSGVLALLVMGGLGYLVGEATTRVARRRRGTSMGIIAAIAVPLGLILANTAHWMLQGANPVLAFSVASATVAIPIWSLLGIVVGAVVAFSRLR